MQSGNLFDKKTLWKSYGTDLNLSQRYGNKIYK